MNLFSVPMHLGEGLRDPAGKFAELRNYALARKPRFVIIGTGRSGTNYSSAYLTAAGVRVSHERYFTWKGPLLRHIWRDWRTIGDSSWCAIPFLPDPEIVAIHQVRHPYQVIGSLHRIGFFDPEHETGQEPYVAFARAHFSFSDDPLRSALRWYVEWNLKCEAITNCRFQIEQFEESLSQIENWIGLPIDQAQAERAGISKTINRRSAVYGHNDDDLSTRLREYPEFVGLAAMAERYGYTL